MWFNPLSRRALARHQARLGPAAFRASGGRQHAPPCDYYVGNDCCNLSSSGVWVCDAGPGGGACTVSMAVGDIPRCSDMFEKDFYTPDPAPPPPRFVNPTATEFGMLPPGSYMGFPSRRRAARRANRLSRSGNPGGYTYPFPVFVPYGAPQPQSQFGGFNWPGLEWVGTPLYYRLG